jgi:tRNA pseudouridine synthase 10
MMLDAKLIDSANMNLANFHGFKFRSGLKAGNEERCWLCNNLFDYLDRFAKESCKKLKKLEFESFLVGSKVKDDVLGREEKMWETTGIEFVESIKSEINRELGKKLEKVLCKEVNFKKPDVLIIADFANKRVELQINSVYVLGCYKKLKRGIPQSKWGTPGHYKTSVQEIVAKPFMKASKGKSNSFHGYGREDIDARCLDWRPFVIEMEAPIKRKFDLKKMEKSINRGSKVKVKILRFCDKSTVRRIKTERGDKTYRVTVKLSKPIQKKDLRKLKKLVGTISQRTPTRVAHRRADLVRKRKVKEIKYRWINRKTIELKVKTNAGLYVKEFVSGNNGRTIPSVAGALGVEATPKNLDVIEIQRPKDI